MNEHQQLHRSYQLAFSDTLRGYIQISAESYVNGHPQTDYLHLFVYGYANTIEVMDINELSTDQVHRIWKTQPLPPGTPVVPISYQDRFIQLQPGTVNDTSFSLESVPDAPFYVANSPDSTNTPDALGDSSGLSKTQSPASVTTTVSGAVRFLDSEGNYHPLVNARIQLYDDDGSWDSQLLGTTVTDASGHFSKTVTGNDWWDSDIEVYGLIKTVNDKVRVLVEYPGTAFLPYTWGTPTTHTSGSDIDWGQISINSGSYSACTIFHRINESWNFTATHGYDPGLITTIYPDTHEDWSYFNLSNERIFIYSDHWLWDYHEDIPRHEYGHALMYHAQDGWWPDYNSPDEHSYTGEYNPGLAWVEGWAHAYTQFVETDGYTSFSYPIENIPGSYPEGYENEARVGASISDLYDSQSDGDDYMFLDYSMLLSVIQNNNIDDLHDYWNQLEDDLSSIQKHYGSRALIYNTIDISLVTNPDPLSVSISGPSVLYIGGTGTFEANVSGGGNGAIVYQWEMQEDGSSNWITLGTSSTQDITTPRDNFIVRVHVDRGYAPTSASKNVRYGGKYPPEPIESFQVADNQPNPFNPVTAITYTVPREATVLMEVYNIAGQQIRTLVNRNHSPGEYRVTWDGRNKLGEQVATGTYFYVYTARSPETTKILFHKTKKMVYLK